MILKPHLTRKPFLGPRERATGVQPSTTRSGVLGKQKDVRAIEDSDSAWQTARCRPLARAW
ncbi:MAG: hypothetical protein ACR2LZ_07315 [Pyrinomonadaceae bacterium]